MTAAGCQSSFHGHFDGAEQLGSIAGDLRRRIQTERVGDMAVSRFRFVVVLQPFHQLTVLSDSHGRQFCPDFLRFHAVFGTDAENFFGFGVEVQQTADDLDIHGGRNCQIDRLLFPIHFGEVAVFRRGGGAGVEVSVNALKQVVHEE